MDLLSQISTREDLLALDERQLEQLCEEIRQFLVLNVAHTGGHLASNLGVVELTVALERVFDTSKDRLLFENGRRPMYGILFQTCGQCVVFSKPCADASAQVIAAKRRKRVQPS